jgi:uncharacterized membrane protein YphA (DoxX/SURF4 family)
METMDHSMAQPRQGLAELDCPVGRHAELGGAILLALVFLVSGLWKLTDAPGAAVRMAQARVPQSLSLAAAIGFGIAETFTAVLLLVPRFRRWGAWLGGALLIAFMIFIGINYNALRGAECSCFPWVKRAVGPGFFIGDGIMLAGGAGGFVGQARESMRSAMPILGAVTLFAAWSPTAWLPCARPARRRPTP